MRRTCLAALTLCLLAASAQAHKASDAYVDLSADGGALHGRFDVALRDLDLALDLDRDADGALTWGELRSRRAEVESYLLSRLSFAAGGAPCPATASQLAIDSHSDGAYAVLSFDAKCPNQPAVLQVDYELLFELDRLHRGILRLATPSGVTTALFGPESRVQQLALEGGSPLAHFAQFVREGVGHIASGTDHVLFLLSLLLPAVLVGGARRWRPAPAFRPVVGDVLRVVTAFTLAHSLTLSLAALGLVHLPSKLVESAIALSVLISALSNLRPDAPRLGPWFAFGFGLVHGLGFASALADIAPDAGSRVATLLGFNLGVELGQLAIVAAFLPLGFLLRRSSFYQRGVVGLGSLAVAGMAAVWLIQRST
jgi:hypothetical protein